MDERLHQYNLDTNALMIQLAHILERRGYDVQQSIDGIWHYHTAWTKGAAQGEIGSLLYSLIARCLEESGE